MLIKNKTKFSFIAVALFFAAISFVACNNSETVKSDEPKVEKPAASAVDDSTTLKGNTKPTPEGNH